MISWGETYMYAQKECWNKGLQHVTTINTLSKINNYWTWGWLKYRDLSVASRSNIIDLQDSDKKWYFAITKFNSCFIINLITKFVFIMNILRKRSDLPWKARFPLRMCRILFAVKHSWTALSMSRPLFVGSYLQITWWALGQWKERKICFEW